MDNLGEYFLPFWADTLAGLFDGTHSGTFINSLMPENPIEILLPDVIDDFTVNNENLFRLTLEENTLLDWAPITPTYLMHAIGDDIIPIANAQVAYNSFINNGAESVNLIFTSPPYPLLKQKAYGNVDEQHYVDWFMTFVPLFHKVLKEDIRTSSSR